MHHFVVHTTTCLPHILEYKLAPGEHTKYVNQRAEVCHPTRAEFTCLKYHEKSYPETYHFLPSSDQLNWTHIERYEL